MKMKTKNTVIYASHFEMIESLSNEQAGELIKTIGRYINGEEYSIDDLTVKGIWMMMNRDFATQLKNYDKRVVANRENGKKGGRPKNTSGEIIENTPSENIENTPSENTPSEITEQPIATEPVTEEICDSLYEDKESINEEIEETINEDKEDLELEELLYDAAELYSRTNSTSSLKNKYKPNQLKRMYDNKSLFWDELKKLDVAFGLKTTLSVFLAKYK